MSSHLRICFQLAQAQGAYPPVSVENIWAMPTDKGEYVLDNIPFFTRQATFGDTVSATLGEDGRLWFTKVVRESGNSLIRVVFFDLARIAEVRRDLEALGCDTELSKNLVAVNIPSTTSLADVQRYLGGKAAQGWIDYEEPILRQ